MKLHLTDGRLVWLITIAILIIDQIIKIEVKTNMPLHSDIEITRWFYISFIENNGMAFGMDFIGKLILSLFRIFAICLIAYYIWCQVKAKARTGYLVCLSMVLAGAIGNIIDNMFYGLIFSESTPYNIATLVNFGEGYASFLTGKVVDMFYFPIIETTLPEWIPLYGGDIFVFFSPIFNFADACISVGVAIMLIFYRKDLSNLSLRNSINKYNQDTD